MGLFTAVEGEVAIIVSNGVYKQAPLFMRNGFLYAKDGAGFIRLNSDGSTSKATARLDTLTFEGQLAIDNMGRLCDLALVVGSKPLPEDKGNKLLGVGP